MKGKDIFKNMSPYKPGKQIEEVKKEYGLNKIVKLASNENPFGYSDQVEAAIPKLINHLEIYPDGYSTELREVLANKLEVDGDQIVFGCGSDEVVDIICRTYLEPGTNTIMATPTFPQYKHNALIQGAEIREVPLVNGYHDLEGMLEEVDEDTRVLWLCSPNNPTGCLIDRKSLEHVLQACPSHVMVVVDEAYYEYITTDEAPDTIASLKDYANLVVLRTFSKAYGLAGLRIGYGVASKEIITLLNITRGPFNTTTIAQGSALIALKDERFLKETISKNTTNKQAFLKHCDALGLEYYDSETNFVFVKLPVSGDEMFEHLLSNGFIVRSGEALGHPNGVRITIGKSEDMEELQQLMHAYLAPLKEENKL
ncbi:histidinol-phosphate transaminase [Aquibacillus koreensis]|uniref:Histidinol-phosphate aminotransferase n=1 Tax=Aquibacillus koreensis TaxID=279446 RepID=A0A9X3WFE9_9BACI|nr:histidinol-phosphate transaminase [Aquibacillus koreensis]MCT2537381.1 histidinol-phosphate transaminase [Aquibacillus koreensis]MDC3418827.1 histidinol-phosphate transaminase [Aquibacillus koreensis]